MRIKGQKIEGPMVEVIIIPRGEGQEDIILHAQAILDMDEFYKLLPEPKAPKAMRKGGIEFFNTEDPRYKAAIIEYNKMRVAWMILKSLQATPDLVWERAKIEDPNTWLLYDKELREAGFSDIEVGRVINGVMAANCLNDTKMEEARKRFLAGQAAQRLVSVSQTDGQDSTPSGEPQNDSV